ncbi:Uncharacterised protein [Legionella lansingensis]|uniref:Uncharacterized protein n=1 Tax=Legionella lansingensis TaxID=45067 RepID=A0A0W0VF93_9GAMM|nr:bacteriophage holin [Legionella lansingensis]KTD18819.1 hypothetical protein Llan_2422 [Legionella lansingensis]SNV43345.1 Uncharacterised protein [Legionella lansingensis]
MEKCKLSPVALGLSLGVIWGVSILLLGLIATFYEYGRPFVTAVGVLYVGYQPTILGSFLGGLIAFIDSFIGGVIIAWLYNLFLCCCRKKDKSE